MHRATMVVMRGRRAEHRKRAKAMFALEHRRALIEQHAIEPSVDRQLPRPAKGGPCLVAGADVITIAPRDGAVSGMEFRTHLVRRGYPHVVRQDCIERTSHSRRIPAFRQSHADRLTSRVNSGISSSGTERRNRPSTQLLECLLHDPLNGALVGLSLPTAESCPVVVQNELHGTLGHCRKTTSAWGSVNCKPRSGLQLTFLQRHASPALRSLRLRWHFKLRALRASTPPVSSSPPSTSTRIT